MVTKVESEQSPQNEEEEEAMQTVENNCSSEKHPERAEDENLLNTYDWHTSAKPEGVGAIEKLEKGAANKWSKMQNWRKVLSEDTSTKQERPTRKNPFRRALSEPPGSLLSTGPCSSSSAAGTSEPSGTNGAASEAPQKGIFRKYLHHVSQKLKRPRLQNRNSGTIIEHETLSTEPLCPEPASLGWNPPQEIPVWDVNHCTLQDGQILITCEDESDVRLRNRASSCLSSLSLQNLLEHPANTSLDQVAPQKSKSQDGGVRAMIKRRLQKKSSTTQLQTAGLTARFGSRDSLSILVSESLDVSADHSTVIRPVHSSILGEKFCFEVIKSESNHCFGCKSAAERDRWIENLRRAAQPNKDNCERTENSLSLWINEAKDLLPKRRYYCELYIDGTLFARTSSRAVGKLSQSTSLAGEGGTGATGGGFGGSGTTAGCQLFWGELFELDNLPHVTQVTLHLFRDEDPKKKRHSKDESVLHPLGSVALTPTDIKGRAFQEKWYPIVPYKPTGTGSTKEQLGTQASLRVKARFQNLRVLPIEKYKEFAEYVTVGYVGMCSSLEPLLNVRDKEELAGALVHVLQSIGKAKEFLIDLGSAEVQRLGENEALIFRENTLATKAIDEYMKLVGQNYLIDTLGEFIARLYTSPESCEVDPQKCSSSELPINQNNLKETCAEVVRQITNMHSSFPVELNEIFSSWVSDSEERGRPEIGHRLISASLFLRFLCPAVLSPSLFGLTQPYPEPNTLRTLTLTAKVIQNLANFTLFGEKEEYMFFMNDFLEQHWEPMRCFLQRVSNPDSELDMARFDGYVDLPLRLAVLHNLLVDIICPMNQETINSLQPLPSILNQITEHLGPDVSRITCTNLNAGQPKPSYVPPRDLGKYSPLNKSLQHLPTESKASSKDRQRKQVVRTQSVPASERRHHQLLKKQKSTEDLPTDTPMAISPPQPSVHVKPPPAPVPWIKMNNKEPYQTTTEHEETSILDKHAQDLSELRLGVEQVAERELEMAKRLEDFIVQSQEQNAQLQAELQDLRGLVMMREEQLASATFRLGVIEEEREEDERRFAAALVAAERMNFLEEQLAGLLDNMQRLNAEAPNDSLRTAYITS